MGDMAERIMGGLDWRQWSGNLSMLRRWPMVGGQCDQKLRTAGSRMKPWHGGTGSYRPDLGRTGLLRVIEKWLKDLKQPAYICFVVFKDHSGGRGNDKLYARWQRDPGRDLFVVCVEDGVAQAHTAVLQVEMNEDIVRYLEDIGGLLANLVCGGEVRKAQKWRLVATFQA